MFRRFLGGVAGRLENERAAVGSRISAGRLWRLWFFEFREAFGDFRQCFAVFCAGEVCGGVLGREGARRTCGRLDGALADGQYLPIFGKVTDADAMEAGKHGRGR